MRRVINCFIIVLTMILLIQVSILAQQLNTLPYQDPYISQINRLPARATSVSYTSRSEAITAVRNASSRKVSLNGEWFFSFSENPTNTIPEFEKEEYDHSDWDRISIPSNWELHGYGKPWQRLTHQIWESKGVREPNVPDDYNPTGCYIKTFKYDPNWSDKRIVLHIGGATAVHYLYVNGGFVGYGEDDRLPSEYDITSYLHKDRPNKIAIKVLQWGDGSYIEDQDHWRMSGLHREVALFVQPTIAINDFEVRSQLVDNYKNGLLEVRPELVYGDLRDDALKCSILVDLLDSNQESVLDSQQVISGKTLLNEHHPVLGNRPFGNLCSIKIPDIHAWSDDDPYLYTLLLTLADSSGQVIEYRSSKVGFRTVETKGGQLLVNGKSIWLYGVNRHDWNQYTGKAVTYEDMWQDAILMKQLNVNASRSSHYPNPPEWYEICDQLGIYVMDEANIESHGKGSLFANDPSWNTAFMERGIRMFERDKNHPSIIMWSLGNEAGHGPNHAGLYGWLKEADPHRLVHLETAQNTFGYFVPDPEPIDKFFTDIRSRMYRTPDKMIPLAVDDRDARPIIWCEYAHSQGQSTGDLQSYWDLIRTYPKLVGAFVWDWRDQLIHKDGSVTLYSHGEDFDQKQDDLMPVQKGLIASDGKIKSGGWEAKKVWQRIRIKPTDKRNEYRIFNDHRWTNTDQLDFEVEWIGDGGFHYIQSVAAPSIPPMVNTLFTCPSPNVRLPDNERIYVTFNWKLNKDAAWAEKGYVVAWDQFLYQDVTRSFEASPYSCLHSIIDEMYTIYIGQSQFTVDRNTGMLASYKSNGKEVFTQPMKLNFWRPPTDNDIASGIYNRQGIWKEAADNVVIKDIMRGDSCGITVIAFLPKVNSTIALNYNLDSVGRLFVDSEFHLDARQPDAPRVGIQFFLDKDFIDLSWFGKGPHENYSDKKEGAAIGHYKENIHDDYIYYVRPQESGNKCDVSHFDLSNGADKISFSMTEPIQMSAWPYSLQNIEEASRIEDLVYSEYITLNLDAAHMGVGGDNTWNIDARPHKDFRVKAGKYELNFVIQYLDNKDKK